MADATPDPAPRRFFFNSPPTTPLYTLSLHDALPISYKQPVTSAEVQEIRGVDPSGTIKTLLDRSLIKVVGRKKVVGRPRSEEHTSELQSQSNLVCRLLLEKKDIRVLSSTQCHVDACI